MVKRRLGEIGRLGEIDGLRALACFMVLLYHTAQFSGVAEIGKWTAPLNSGVDIFIVLSGFCLFLPVAVDSKKFAAMSFWRHRLKRIVPAYYASMIYVVLLPEVLVVFWRLLGRHASWQAIPSPIQWITHLTFTHMFSTHTWDGINGSYWSLGLEAQFYVAMPLIVFLFRRYGIRGLIIPAAVSVVWNVSALIIFWGTDDFTPIKFIWEVNLFGRWLEFTGGAFAAYLVQRTRTGRLTLSNKTRSALTVAGLASIILDLYVVRGSALGPIEFAILPLGIIILILGVSTMPDAGPTTATRLLRLRPMRALGTISYSFYLIHQPTEWYFSQLLKGMGVVGYSLWIAEITLGTAIIVGLATISYHLFREAGARFAAEHQLSVVTD